MTASRRSCSGWRARPQSSSRGCSCGRRNRARGIWTSHGETAWLLRRAAVPRAVAAPAARTSAAVPPADGQATAGRPAGSRRRELGAGCRGLRAPGAAADRPVLAAWPSPPWVGRRRTRLCVQVLRPDGATAVLAAVGPDVLVVHADGRPSRALGRDQAATRSRSGTYRSGAAPRGPRPERAGGARRGRGRQASASDHDARSLFAGRCRGRPVGDVLAAADGWRHEARRASPRSCGDVADPGDRASRRRARAQRRQGPPDRPGNGPRPLPPSWPASSRRTAEDRRRRRRARRGRPARRGRRAAQLEAGSGPWPRASPDASSSAPFPPRSPTWPRWRARSVCCARRRAPAWWTRGSGGREADRRAAARTRRRRQRPRTRRCSTPATALLLDQTSRPRRGRAGAGRCGSWSPATPCTSWAVTRGCTGCRRWSCGSTTSRRSAGHDEAASRSTSPGPTPWCAESASPVAAFRTAAASGRASASWCACTGPSSLLVVEGHRRRGRGPGSSASSPHYARA